MVVISVIQQFYLCFIYKYMDINRAWCVGMYAVVLERSTDISYKKLLMYKLIILLYDIKN